MVHCYRCDTPWETCCSCNTFIQFTENTMHVARCEQCKLPVHYRPHCFLICSKCTLCSCISCARCPACFEFKCICTREAICSACGDKICLKCQHLLQACKKHTGNFSTPPALSETTAAPENAKDVDSKGWPWVKYESKWHNLSETSDNNPSDVSEDYASDDFSDFSQISDNVEDENTTNFTTLAALKQQDEHSTA